MIRTLIEHVPLFSALVTRSSSSNSIGETRPSTFPYLVTLCFGTRLIATGVLSHFHIPATIWIWSNVNNWKFLLLTSFKSQKLSNDYFKYTQLVYCYYQQKHVQYIWIQLLILGYLTLLQKLMNKRRFYQYFVALMSLKYNCQLLFYIWAWHFVVIQTHIQAYIMYSAY